MRGRAVIAAATAALALAGPAAAARTPAFAPTAAGQARAAAALLAVTDLPHGFRVVSPGRADWTTISCPGFAPDLSDVTLVGRAERSFAGGGSSGLPAVSSFAEVVSTADKAAQLFSRMIQPGLMPCIATELQRGSPKGMTFTTRSKVLTPLASLGDRAARLRVVVVARQAGTSVPVVAELVAVQKATVVAVFLAVSLQAPLANDEVLVGRIVSRM